METRLGPEMGESLEEAGMMHEGTNDVDHYSCWQASKYKYLRCIGLLDFKLVCR